MRYDRRLSEYVSEVAAYHPTGDKPYDVIERATCPIVLFVRASSTYRFVPAMLDRVEQVKVLNRISPGRRHVRHEMDVI